MKVRQTIVILFLLFNALAFGQSESERNMYSFKTTKGKFLSLSLDTISNTLSYRYGKPNNVELEIIDNLNDDKVVFSYSFYFRGGGVQNAGIDYNYVTFVNGDYEYSVFYEYSAEKNSVINGVRITNMKTKNVDVINGLIDTAQGSLVTFRFEDIIPLID